VDDAVGLREFHETEGVEDWRIVGDGACAFFRTGTLTESAKLVEAISEMPGVDAHPPDIDVRPDGVTVRLLTLTDDYCGITQRDVALARHVSAAASSIGLVADPARVQSVLIIPGAKGISGRKASRV
jgi:4a-hydroxytetrahydrobiopterin dehydratase